MRMDRNLNEDGCGKYAVINMRRLNDLCGHVGTFERWTPAVEAALKTLEDVDALEWGTVGSADEFFLVKLKDANAEGALLGYADKARLTDPEFADEVLGMAARSGPHHPLCKQPD